MPIGGEIEKGNRLAGLDEDFADKLGEFVRNGGGLVIACGDKVKESVDQVEVADAGGARKWEPRFAYNRVFGSGSDELLPFDFKGVQETSELNSYSLARKPWPRNRSSIAFAKLPSPTFCASSRSTNSWT